MTEAQMLAALYSKFAYSGTLALLSHFTPKTWWECDALRITSAGYAIEYELKISRKDYLADFRKCRRAWSTRTMEQKHTLLALRTGWPSRFYFVMPAGLADQVQIPEHAGLIAVGGADVPYLRTVRPAPQLHDRPAGPQVIQTMGRNGLYRLANQVIESGM